MGNAAATLGITVDNSNGVIPGVTTTGRVYLDVRHDHVDASSLMFRVLGGEYTTVRYTTTSKQGKNTVTHHHTVHSSSIFLDLVFPLTNIPSGRFVKGQYEFPFQFTLPYGVQPSTQASLPGNHGGYCKLQYHIDVRLHRPGIFKWDVSNRLPIHVLGGLVHTLPTIPAYVSPLAHNVTTCCCYKRGAIRMGLYTPKSLLAAGESFNVSYVIDNASTATIKRIIVDVIEVVSWVAQGRHRTIRSILYSQQLLPQQLSLDQIAPKRPNPTTNIGPSVLEELSILKQVLDTCKYVVQARIDASAQTSMQGKLMSVKHFIEFKACTTFGTSNPEIMHPLLIHRHGLNSTTPVHQQPQQLPQGWNPHVSVAVAVPVPSFVQAIMVEQEEAPDPQNFSTIPTSVNYQGFPALCVALRSTYDQINELKNWLRINSADLLTPDNFKVIYTEVNNSLNQVCISEVLVEARTGVTCEHIAAALSACDDVIKIDVASKLGSKCVDKEHYELVKRSLSDFQFICVQHIFQS